MRFAAASKYAPSIHAGRPHAGWIVRQNGGAAQATCGFPSPAETKWPPCHSILMLGLTEGISTSSHTSETTVVCCVSGMLQRVGPFVSKDGRGLGSRMMLGSQQTKFGDVFPICTRWHEVKGFGRIRDLSRTYVRRSWYPQLAPSSVLVCALSAAIKLRCVEVTLQPISHQQAHSDHSTDGHYCSTHGLHGICGCPRTSVSSQHWTAVYKVRL